MRPNALSASYSAQQRVVICSRRPPVTYRSCSFDRSETRAHFPGCGASQRRCSTTYPKVRFRIRNRRDRTKCRRQTQPRGVGQKFCLHRDTPQQKAKPSLESSFLGETFAAPFAVAPLGLSGLIWPRSGAILARAARNHNIPYILSNFGTDSLERIAGIGETMLGCQLYPPCNSEVEDSHLSRLKLAGYKTMVVTVDTPTATRRPHDIKNGLSVPPRIDIRTVYPDRHAPDLGDGAATLQTAQI